MYTVFFCMIYSIDVSSEKSSSLKFWALEATTNTRIGHLFGIELSTTTHGSKVLNTKKWWCGNHCDTKTLKVAVNIW